MNVENKHNLINREKEKKELKSSIIEQTLYQKYSAANYEIPDNLFNLTKNDTYGNCIYCCISYYLYKNQDSHLSIRHSVFDYIKTNKVDFYIFFL